MIRWLLIVLSFGWCLSASAQVNLRLSLERDKYLIYEPIMATVQVENYGARQLKFNEAESEPWLKFEIIRKDGQRVSMIGPGFLAGTASLDPGQALGKNANLTAYYGIRELGIYRIRAKVKVAGIGGGFLSNERVIEVVAGRQLWAKAAGVLGKDDKESLRTYSLMTLRLGQYNRLYARIEDDRAGLVYGVIPLGPWVTLGPPNAEIDKEANLHVLHQVAPRNFRYVVVSPNGAVQKREEYSDFESHPELKKDDKGKVKVIGGEITFPAPPAVVSLRPTAPEPKQDESKPAK